MTRPTRLIPVALLFMAMQCRDTEPQPGLNFTINTPVPNLTIAHGDSVRIVGEITAPADMRGYALQVRNLQADTLPFGFESRQHGKRYAYRTGFVNTATAHTECEFTVRAMVGDSGRTEERKVRFSLHPH